MLTSSSSYRLCWCICLYLILLYSSFSIRNGVYSLVVHRKPRRASFQPFAFHVPC
ncbi:hypothetical protein K449DRAFT_391133 [Hypoxylon sp. EC38]|nr:hypothetical protein K449DRAFT_391133 [Hypoxylon sp. EC38]